MADKRCRTKASLPFQSGHLTIVLGNLLDNALEACLKMKSETRFVEIEASYQKSMLLISIRNSFKGKRYKDKNGSFLSTKQDQRNHGFGLSSATQAVIPYHGQILSDFQKNVFLTSVVMFEP